MDDALADPDVEVVELREALDEDLPILFKHQRDPQANTMAAFPARDWGAFVAHAARLHVDETVTNRTIVVGGQVAGSIVCWLDETGERDVGYWLGREFWGRGLATRALSAFLGIVPDRPLHARVAKHNAGSRRVLEKCGFTVVGQDVVAFEAHPGVDVATFGPGPGPGDIEEWILRLD